MNTEKPQETLARKLSNLLNRYAIWPTFFIAILLLLAFYNQFIITESSKTQLFLEWSQFLNGDPLPLWNPHLQSGVPAPSQPGVIGHLNILDSALYAMISPIQAYVPDVAFTYLLLNLLVFCGFTFAFLRRLGVAPLPASFTSIIVLFIPQYVINIVSGQWIEVMALSLLPVVLYFSHLLFETRKLVWWCVAAFFFTFQVLRGSLYISLATALVMFTFMLIHTVSQPTQRGSRFFKNVGLLLGIWVFAFIGAGYVYFPFLDLFRYSTINQNVFSFHLNDLFLFILPSYNGAIVNAEFQIMFYFGVLLIFLAGFGLLLRRDAVAIGLISLFLVLLVLALFNYHQLAVYAVPYLTAILAAFGINRLIHYRSKTRDRKRSRWLDVYMLMIISVFAALLVTLFLNETGFKHHILQEISLLTLPQQHAAFVTVLLEAAIAFAVIAFSFIVVRLFLRDIIPVAGFILILLITALVELAIVDVAILSQVHPPSPVIPAALQERLQQDASLYRIFLTDPHRQTEFHSVTGKSTVQLRRYRNFLKETGLDVPDLPWMRNPFFAKYTRLVFRGDDIVEQPIPVQNIKPERLHFDRAMLDLLNVKYILCHSPIHDPNYAELEDSSMFVYENLSVMPRAFFVDSVHVMPGPRAIFDAMDDPDFDPRRVAFLEQQPPFQVEKADSNSLTLQSYRNVEIVASAHVTRPAMLIFSEVFYPAGWQAFVNGAETPVLRANSFMRSVFLEPGTHEIRLVFRPLSFRIGKWSSMGAAALLVAGLIVGLIFVVRKRDESSEELMT